MFTKLPSYPFAVVEYDTYVEAFRASKELTNTDDWRRGLKVELLMKLKNPNGKDKENKNTGEIYLNTRNSYKNFYHKFSI